MTWSKTNEIHTPEWQRITLGDTRTLLWVMRAQWLFFALFVTTLLLGTSCATAPSMRAPIPRENGAKLEVGLGAGAAVDPDLVPAGTGVFFGSFGLSDSLDISLNTSGLGRIPTDEDPFKHQLQAQLGLRYHQEVFLDTWLAIELFGGYAQRDILSEEVRPLLDAGVRFLVAQQMPGIPMWVYAAPTIGLSVPLKPVAGEDPAAQLSECPLGLLYRFQNGLSLYAEGGLWTVSGGGFGAIGISYSL